jgi:hypothetical protein
MALCQRRHDRYRRPVTPRRRLALIALPILGLAACGGATKAATPAATVAPVTAAPTTAPPVVTTVAPTTVAPTTTVPPTTVAPTTTTTIDPMETARLAYAGLTSGTNPVIDELYKTYKASRHTLADVQTLCAVLAPVEESFANSIRDGNWPSSVQAEADALAKADAALTFNLYRCANATTLANAVAAWNTPDNVADAASAMRLALGMPINR